MFSKIKNCFNLKKAIKKKKGITKQVYLHGNAFNDESLKMMIEKINSEYNIV